MKKETIGIVGGGITGITAAIELSRQSVFDVTLFEKDEVLGGLCAPYKWNSMELDRFYHVILSSDYDFRNLLDDLNFSDKLYWSNIKTGFYGKGITVSNSSVFDYITFPFLTLFQKIRLGFGILSITRTKYPEKLNSLSATQWLISIFGQNIYEKFWQPLLKSKFGSSMNRISAEYMWATIHRLYTTRRSLLSKEKMGYIYGGYQALLKALELELIKKNVDVKKGHPITSVELSKKNKKISLFSNSKRHIFDRILLTAPWPEIQNICVQNKDEFIFKNQRDVEYLGIVCVIYILRTKLSPYYIINLLDQDLPFTGIIETTNVILPKDIQELNLIYLPRYLCKNDKYFVMKDEKLIAIFTNNLRKIFPNLSNKDILHTKVFREKYVQPIRSINSHRSGDSFRTRIPNIYVANSSHIIDSTLNNNAAVKLAKLVASRISSDASNREEIRP